MAPLPGRASIARTDNPCTLPANAPAVEVEEERVSASDLTLLMAPVTVFLDCEP
ncbi:MAG: hypothetical protein LUE98_06355 [Tannerellaceae bacterium]|nr:hypothetical protein [Tannerellaceae bacterium]